MKPRDLIGKTLGQAIIEKEVGRGGMAIVFKGKHTILGKSVAVKILQRGLLFNDDESMDRFRNEAKALARLDHPYIVVLYDYGEQDDVQYMITQFVEGNTLKELIERKRKSPMKKRSKLYAKYF